MGGETVVKLIQSRYVLVLLQVHSSLTNCSSPVGKIVTLCVRNTKLGTTPVFFGLASCDLRKVGSHNGRGITVPRGVRAP